MTFNINDIFLAYLRKSREDRDAEINGAEDTLARQEYTLNQLAARYNIKIAKWYKEVVSGETISARPEMQKLLHDVEELRPAGVLCVEIERLSRGNSQDQGLVTDTFKYSGTLIITPAKIYNLDQENDEEWLDFGLMRSRMEYRTIKRRLQNGRKTSARQGLYTGNKTPFGWKRVKLQHEKGYILEEDKEHSHILRMIYNMLDTGTSETGNKRVGTALAAHILNDLDIKPMFADKWEPSVITSIVRNPVNAGMVRIGYRKQVKTMVDGKIKTSRPVNKSSEIVKARWDGIISEEQFERVNKNLNEHSYTARFTGSITNPFAGILKCAECKKIMYRRPKGPKTAGDVFYCKTHNCPTVGSYCDLVEDRLLSMLNDWLDKYRILVQPGIDDIDSLIKVKEVSLKQVKDNVQKAQVQLQKVCDFFEQDIYTLEMFQDRSASLNNKITQYRSDESKVLEEIKQLKTSKQNQKEVIPRWERVLSSYRKDLDPLTKNALLKELLVKVEYKKTKKGSKKDPVDLFSLEIFPRI